MQVVRTTVFARLREKLTPLRGTPLRAEVVRLCTAVKRCGLAGLFGQAVLVTVELTDGNGPGLEQVVEQEEAVNEVDAIVGIEIARLQAGWRSAVLEQVVEEESGGQEAGRLLAVTETANKPIH